MFERLLAALIILALLVLVMFIALPYTPGNERTNAPVLNPPAAPAPTESAKVNPPPVKPEIVVKNDPVPPPEKPAPPPPPEKQAPPPPEKPVAETPNAPVPNPPGNTTDKADQGPPAAERHDREIAGGNAPPKQIIVKYQDRLPISPGAEPPPKSYATPRYDKPAIERTKTEIVPRPVLRVPPRRILIKSDREVDDDFGEDTRREYVRRDAYAPPVWTRGRYSECAEGRCDCGCGQQPYWARRSPGCPD